MKKRPWGEIAGNIVAGFVMLLILSAIVAIILVIIFLLQRLFAS